MVKGRPDSSARRRFADRGGRLLHALVALQLSVLVDLLLRRVDPYLLGERLSGVSVRVGQRLLLPSSARSVYPSHTTEHPSSGPVERLSTGKISIHRSSRGHGGLAPGTGRSTHDHPNH